MIGERLAELRKLNGETQEDLAKAFHVSVPTVRTWERDKASPSHEVLIALCKRYGTSADYLLGLTDIDPSDEARKQRQRLTEEEQNEMHRLPAAGASELRAGRPRHDDRLRCRASARLHGRGCAH